MGTDGVTRRRIARAVELTLNLGGVIIPVLAVALAGILTWQHLTTWRDLAILAVMYLPTSLGMTVGFHRMLTHRSFEAHPAAKFVLLALGCTAGMTDPVRFAAVHVQHHATSDRDGDPHSPLDGLFHSHMGWFLLGYDADPQRYVPWLVDDSMVQFFRRTTGWWRALGFVVPFVLGGWTGLLWGGWVRFFLTIHMTFSVNSICHTFGRVAFRTEDRSRNHWLFGVIGLGEGWHNNHHAFPRSAFHGLQGWQIDVSGYLIAAMEQLGLATDVHRVSPRLLKSRRVQAGRT